MAYSSREQEKFYQPHRIVVCQVDPGRYRGYQVLRIDTTKRYPEEGFVAATWHPASWRNTDGHWEEGYSGRHRYDSKQRAQDVAKEQAVVLKLPYSIQDDYYGSWRELLNVQEIKCVICGKGIGYHAAPNACDDCRLYAERGRLLDQEQEIYSIESKDLCTGHAGYDFDLPLARAFYRLVGDVPKGKRAGRIGDHTLDHVRTGKSQGTIARGGSGRGCGTLVSMTAAQAEALQEIVDIIERIDKAAYGTGKLHGSNILTRLAAGELPPDAFNRKRIEEGDKQ